MRLAFQAQRAVLGTNSMRHAAHRVCASPAPLASVSHSAMLPAPSSPDSQPTSIGSSFDAAGAAAPRL